MSDIHTPLTDDQRWEIRNQVASAHLVLGWAHAYFCTLLDEGVDPRLIEVPEIIEAMEKDVLAAAPEVKL